MYPCDVAYKVVMDDKNAIRGYYRRGGDPLQEEEGSEEGLPPLKFGTINDPLPEGWVFNPQPTMGNFFAGNVSNSLIYTLPTSTADSNLRCPEFLPMQPSFPQHCHLKV